MSFPEKIKSSSPRITLAALYLMGLLSTGALAVTSVQAAEEGQYKVSHGVAAYLGFLPAEMVTGHPKMNGSAPRGPHAYHLVVALFNQASGERISDANVTVRIAAPGMAGEVKSLQPMEIAGTRTYGTFLTLPGADRYTIALNIQQSGARDSVGLEFVYDHRNR